MANQGIGQWTTGMLVRSDRPEVAINRPPIRVERKAVTVGPNQLFEELRTKASHAVIESQGTQARSGIPSAMIRSNQPNFFTRAAAAVKAAVQSRQAATVAR